ncbi:MAG: Rho termination factor N-terminal domain-containing protein [Deltaproteobacteria bacterium]|nr:Rho termination factor N-terminal domain-containing protein [Deltaproteobacteria bacterium]MBW2661868.1 Rho termination factor N-terminal domain-containing protein [Deltaproteobacteria bacterium]
MGTRKKETKEKPLDKMTVKELKEIAKEIPEITGIHGMNKTELLSDIKKAKGIKDETGKKIDFSVREIKKKIKELKASHETVLDTKDKKAANIYRRRLSRLKKKTRQAA